MRSTCASAPAQSGIGEGRLLGGNVKGKRIAILGLAFKPDSDDVRDSPALSASPRRCSCRAPHVTVTDPQGDRRTPRAKWPDLHFADTAIEAATGRRAWCCWLTEWAEYRELDPDALGEVVAHRRMLDGRNVLEPAQWRAAGWTYRALGRP